MVFRRPFQDRAAAGRALAQELGKRAFADPIVLALPRGGVPVGAELARVLKCPLDLIFVRKIGVPGFQELAAAAVVDGSAPEVVINEEVVGYADVPQSYIDEQVKVELQEIERRRREYLGARPAPKLEDRTVIVVDDGIATGTSMKAALKAVRRKNPKSLVLAVPVAPRESIEELRALVDEAICLEMPDPFYAVGAHYREFHQLADDEVVRLLGDIEKEQKSGSTTVAT
jgi:putative phosphoribosyl transferase